MFPLVPSLLHVLLPLRDVREIALENLALRRQFGGDEKTISATTAAKDGPGILGLVIQGLE